MVRWKIKRQAGFFIHTAYIRVAFDAITEFTEKLLPAVSDNNISKILLQSAVFQIYHVPFQKIIFWRIDSSKP